jgi:phosphatidylglycerophosphate synthase
MDDSADPSPSPNRRPLKTRDTGWARAAARGLAAAVIRPNTVSVASVVFAAGALAAYVASNQVQAPGAAVFLMIAALLIQLRLLCNLLDGMIAIEGGFKTRTGDIYNELPDRFADLLIIGGAGYAIDAHPWQAELAWITAGLAVTIAYVRALGVTAGTGQMFHGPMAKPHRMALLTAASIAQAGALLMSEQPVPILFWALVLMAVGCLITLVRRTRRILSALTDS